MGKKLLPNFWRLTIPLCLFLLALGAPRKVSACGNSRSFFGCAPDLFYDIPEDVVQIAEPLGCGFAVCIPPEGITPSIVHPPQPGQVRLPAPFSPILTGQHPRSGALDFPCPSRVSSNDAWLCNYAQLYAEMHAQYVDRYPIRHLFDGNPQTAWAEGVNGDGTGVHFLIGSNVGPLHIVGIELTNGCTKDGQEYAGNNRVRALRLTVPTGRTTTRYRQAVRKKTAWDELWVALQKTFAGQTVAVADIPQSQQIPIAPIATQEILITLAGTYRGPSPFNDTCLSSLRFLLADGSHWPEPQAYWLEQVPGSRFFPSPPIITDIPLARATAALRLADATERPLITRLDPVTGGDVDGKGEVEPSAHLIAAQGYLISGGLLADLTARPVAERPLNPSLKAFGPNTYRTYEGIYPIRFAADGSRLCLYDGNRAELVLVTIPEGRELIRRPVSSFTLSRLAWEGLAFLGAEFRERGGWNSVQHPARPGFVLYPRCGELLDTHAP